MGFYCVDNLPVELMPIFAELHAAGEGDFARAALMIDAREGLQLQKLPPLLKHLRKDHPITLVFIEAQDDALLRRYSETRRPHPLGKDYSVRESLRCERELMSPIRKLADVVIDTTQFNVHELRQFVTERFKNPDKRPLMVSVVSFGYRYGVPTDADLVFDVRFPAKSPLRSAAAGIYRKRSQGASVHSFLSADGGVFAACRRTADIFDSSLCARRQKLFDDRFWLYGWKAPFGDDV